MTDAQQQVLNAIAHASSASPMSLRDILPAASISLDAVIKTLDDLYTNSIINRCLITKNGLEQQVYWPTAKSRNPDKWSDLSVTPNKTIAPPRRDEIKPIQHKTTTMQPDDIKPKSTAETIRDTINANPGIPHESLLNAGLGDWIATPTLETEDDYKNLEIAFNEIYEFCKIELGWMFFRADRLLTGDEKSMTLNNAKMLLDKLETLKTTVPIVAKVLMPNV